MTVAHMRIDNRLIHGQVTLKWAGHVAADRMVVVNDEVAADPIQRAVLPQAARGVKTSVATVEQTIRFTQSEKGKAERIFIIAKFASDALALLEGGVQVEKVNVGNQAPIPGTDFAMVTRTCAVTKEDAAIYRKIAEIHGSLDCQMVPEDRKMDFIPLLEKAGL